MGNNIDIDLFTQKSEITTSTPDITIEITGLVQLNSFIGLDDTPTYYENGKFFKVEDNKIVYTDINWGDIKGKVEDNPELKAEVDKLVEQEAKRYTGEIVSKAITAHDNDANAHQSIQLAIQDNYTTLDNKIELNKIDSNTKFDEVNKKVSDNIEYITRVDNYSQEVNKKLEDLTLEVDVDIKGSINQLREDLTTTNQVVQDNYTALDTKIDNTKSDLSDNITALETKVDNNYTTLDTKIDNTKTELDTKIDTTKAELTKDISNKYTALDTRVSTNTKDIADLTQTVQNDYKEVNSHITDLYNKKVDKVEGKELSTNDFTNEFKSKLENIEATAQVNIIESISVDGIPQTIDGNKNVDLHQPVYTLIKKNTPVDTNVKEYNLTIDGTTTGVTIEIPKDVYIEKCTLKYVTTIDTPYTGAKVNDAYLQFDRANSTPLYTPISELQIHAGQDITVDENNVISTVIPIPRKISELNNDNYTVTDENYVHTDNNFTDGYITRIETLETNTTDNTDRITDLEKTTFKNVEYSKETQKITVTFGDKTTKVLTLEELLTGASYDGETGDFTFTKSNGEPVVVNTPKENFLSDVQYDGTTKIITFTMSSGATFEVNVSDLIDVYTVKSTNSVDMSITEGGQISSNVKVSATDGNIISVETDGIYAKHQDISHLATKDEVNTGLNTKVDTTTFTNELAKKVDTAIYTAGLATKVDKVEGKSLIENTEIERLKTLKNYDDTQIKTDITDINSVLETKASTTDLENGLKTKQDKLTFDTTPTTNSSNPVTSDGIKIELDKKVNSTTLTTELAEKQNKLTAGTGIKIEGDIISNTQTSAEWGNIQGDITAQEDLQNALNTKASTTSVTTLEGEVTDLSGRVTANEADIILKADKTALDIKQDKLVSGTNIKTINNESLLGEGNIEVKSGGSGLEVCDIGMALYVDETKGLRRYLNGQIVDINTNTQAFLNRLQEITTLHPSLLCTEEEWQSAKTMSAFGQVGKFVFNYSGDKIVSVRIPRVVNVQGLFDLQNLGMTVDESLPNISGMFITSTPGDILKTNGCIKSGEETTDTNTRTRGSGVFGFRSFKMNVDASGSSSTYQDNAPVQQEAIQYPYFIQIATGSETENNIINDIELNNPYSLFDSKYSDHELNNLSWLKSEGQWNAKAVYPTAYDKLLKVYNGTETVAGLSVKLSTETYTDYDFVLNTTDETFRLPLLDGSEDLPSDRYIDIELISSGSDYTAPANGWLTSAFNSLSTTGSPKEGTSALINRTNKIGIRSSAYYNPTQVFLPVYKGDNIELSYLDTGTLIRFRFIYAQGNGSLYYYVGETIQNANLIDAGRLLEILPDKLDKLQIPIGQPQITLSNTLEDNEIWLEGATVSRTTYAELFKIYGTTYGTGDGSTTFVLPNFKNRAIWGSNEFGYIGAGLPNITGSFTSDDAGGNPTGAFYVSGYPTGDGGNGGGWRINLDASRSSSIYGKSNTVQPPAIKVRVKTRYK